MQDPIEYYSQQYDARAAIPDHPYVFTRWVHESARVRRSSAALLDLAYGDASGERLDFFPASRSDAPLLVFIHGGWWRSLDKSDFSFIAPAYTRAGFNVALTNYALAPAASLEQIVSQQQRALIWLYRHAEHYDFDPARICVAGHSAGAHLAAMLLASDWPQLESGLRPDLLHAAILLSGLYDLEPLLHAPFIQSDLRLTPQHAALLSPAGRSPALATPFLTAVGGLESDEFKRQNALIGQAWKAGHRADIALPAANHLTICDAFASAGEPLFDAVVDFLAPPSHHDRPPCATAETA
ncbi:MAG TPA: alpha/beta hydrolase [Burkholderiaceae bacterium]|nr:alpha/beta hydrolase [Burkholderiaceae bacterium]